MKGIYYSKNICSKGLLLHYNLWRGTTNGETLYRRLFTGVKTKFLTPFLILYGYRTRLKSGEELPSGSHCPKINKNQVERNIIEPLVFNLNLRLKILHQKTIIISFLRMRIIQYIIKGGSSSFCLVVVVIIGDENFVTG